MDLIKINESTIKTISSIELCDLINKIRKEENVKAELLHKNLLVKIKNELDLDLPENIERAKILAGCYIDVKGEKRLCYNLPQKEAMLVVASESKKVRKRLMDEIERLTIENKELKERFLDSYMIEDPTKRALKWIEERQEFNKQIEEKNNIIQEKQETIDIIKVNQGERTYKKQLKTDIVKIVKLINLSTGISYSNLWNEIYNKFIKMHNFTWNLEFFKSPNKLEYIADKNINYLKDLKQIATSMI